MDKKLRMKRNTRTITWNILFIDTITNIRFWLHSDSIQFQKRWQSASPETNAFAIINLNLLLLACVWAWVCLTIAVIWSSLLLRNAQVQMKQRFYPNKTIFCVHLCLRNTIDFFSLTFETSKIQIFNRTKREIQQHIHENLPLKQKTTTMTTHTHTHTHPFDVFTLNFLEKTLSKHWDLVYFVYRHMKSPLLILLTQWWHFRMVYKHTP